MNPLTDIRQVVLNPNAFIRRNHSPQVQGKYYGYRTPKTVVILGEEFAGIRLAKELSRLTTNDRTLDIDLVNQENCFAFQPMLPVKIPLSH